jgi:hypothetical protein
MDAEMDASLLEDRIRWGLNVAARAIGVTTSAYRPHGPETPLTPRNRFLRLHAAFSDANGKFLRPVGYGDALWCGIFDAAYTQPGDYLVQQDATWFIAAQQKLLPVLCVKTNRTISFSRPAPQSITGINTYGGVTAATVTPLMTNWPASVMVESREGRPLAKLPDETSVSNWTVLLPGTPGVVIQSADLMSDDLGRSGIVSTTELTDLGWRLAVRQVTA